MLDLARNVFQIIKNGFGTRRMKARVEILQFPIADMLSAGPAPPTAFSTASRSHGHDGIQRSVHRGHSNLGSRSSSMSVRTTDLVSAIYRGHGPTARQPVHQRTASGDQLASRL